MGDQMAPALLRLRALRCVALCCALLCPASACIRTSSIDVSNDAPYRELVGREYRVGANDLHAYFLRDNYPDRAPTSVLLLPGVGIANRFVAFRRHVEPGAVLRIDAVMRSWTLAGRYYYCMVEFENADISRGLPVKVDLNDQPGGGVDLDPIVYTAILR